MSAVHPVALSVLQTLGVALLAIVGAALGRWSSRLRSPWWCVGYVGPFLLLLTVLIPRWVVGLEQFVPFRWALADRTEFALMAFAAMALLTTPLSRLRRRRERVMVGLFAAFICVYCCLPPFLMPAFNYPLLRRLEPRVSRDGVCLQSTSYTDESATSTAGESFSHVTTCEKCAVRLPRAGEGPIRCWNKHAIPRRVC